MSSIGGNNKRGGSNLGGRGGSSLGGRGGSTLGGTGGSSIGGPKPNTNQNNQTDSNSTQPNVAQETNNNETVNNNIVPETNENTNKGGATLGGGASIGGPKGGASIGGHKGGSTIGGGASIGGPKGGATLGGGASIGGPKGGASIGGPKGGSTIGGGASIGGPKGGATLGGGASIGGPKGGASIGGPKGGSTIGGGASIGGPKPNTNQNNQTTPKVNESPVNTSEDSANTNTANNEVNTSTENVNVTTSTENAENTEQTTAAKKKKKKKPVKGEKAEEKTETKKGPGGKKPSAALARIKAMQEEQERRKQEEERLKKEEEERERLRIEREKLEEEERLKQLEERKKRREEDKEKRKEKEAQRARDEAAKKYGMVVPTHTGQTPGNARGGKKSKVARIRKPNQKSPGNEIPTDTKTESPKEVKENWDDEDVKENWDDEPSTPVKEKKVEEIKESWDQDIDDKSEEIKESWDQEPDVVEDPNQIKIVLETNTENPTDSPIEDVQDLSGDDVPDLDNIELDVDESKLTKQEIQKLREEKQKALKEEIARQKEINLNRVKNRLRAPICCVLGHVDTGKTLLLDKMRNSNVQAGEAGGITQQIGATFFPLENLRKMTSRLNEKVNLNFKVPGLLVIDTPGHASFTNLRSRGTSLCDISILVIDIMHGIEPQTRESIQLLKKRNTPFVVALNKVDRLYGWRVCNNTPIRDALKLQQESVIAEFDTRVRRLEGELAAEGLNSCLYYKNKDFRKNISLIPTSAVSGEGIPDILMLLIQLTQKHMEHRLTSKSDRVECTVLEVKKLPGIGATIDVILANGTLRIGDTIVIAGLGGEAIVTNIKSLLTPPLMKELRVKSQYQKHNEIHAAMGLKISAQNLDDAVPGSQLFVLTPDEDIDELKATVQEAVTNLQTKIHRSGLGVYVQASTLGSMEALLEFLHEDCKIPVAGIRIGPVHKKDVMTASVMIDRGRPEYACILAFDVQVTPEAEQFAEQQGVRIFSAEIIYHLEKMFKDYLDEIKQRKEEEARRKAVFPCVFSFMPDHIFRDRDPIVAGVHVEDGVIKVGTPVCIFKEAELLEIGRVSSIEKDHKTVEEAHKGDEIAINIAAGHKKYLYGRHFDHNDKVFSHITRESLDALKDGFPDFCSEKENFKILKKMKKVFNIM